MIYKNKWCIYPWSPEYGDDLIASDDLIRFQQISPRGKVFYCADETDGYLKLKYGNDVFSVKPNLFEEVTDPGHHVGESVVVNVGSSKGKRAIILSMDWHYQKKEVMYTLEVDGKKKSNRYLAGDLIAVE